MTFSSEERATESAPWTFPPCCFAASGQSFLFSIRHFSFLHIPTHRAGPQLPHHHHSTPAAVFHRKRFFKLKPFLDLFVLRNAWGGGGWGERWRDRKDRERPMQIWDIVLMRGRNFTRRTFASERATAEVSSRSPPLFVFSPHPSEAGAP